MRHKRIYAKETRTRRIDNPIQYTISLDQWSLLMGMPLVWGALSYIYLYVSITFYTILTMNTEQNLSCLWWKSIAERKLRELRGEITNSQQMAQWKALQATKCTGERTDNRQSEKLTSIQFIQSRNDNDIWCCVWKTNADVYFKSFIVIFNHQQIIIFL